MLYSSFAGCTGNSFCYAMLLTVWCILFLNNMLRKEKSIIKKEGGKLYTKNSYMIWPKIAKSHFVNFIIIISFASFFYYDYQ